MVMLNFEFLVIYLNACLHTVLEPCSVTHLGLLCLLWVPWGFQPVRAVCQKRQLCFIFSQLCSISLSFLVALAEISSYAE